MNKPLVKIKKLNEKAKLPVYKSKEAAGADLCACLSESVTLPPHGWDMIPAGFAMSLPEGWEAQVRPRSGLAAKKGVTVLNTPGTIDSDYRGEVKIILINHSDVPYEIHDGERIAQMVISPCSRADFSITKSLDETERSTGGFGSTGK